MTAEEQMGTHTPPDHIIIPAPGDGIQLVPADSAAAVAWLSILANYLTENETADHLIDLEKSLLEQLAHLESRIEHLEVTLLGGIDEDSFGVKCTHTPREES